MSEDVHEKLQRAKVASARLSPDDLRGAESLASDLANLAFGLDMPGSPNPTEIEWAIGTLESLNRLHPGSAEIAAAFARSLRPFYEHNQDVAAVDRKLRRLEALSASFPQNQRVAASVAGSLCNVALSHRNRSDFAAPSEEAGRRLEAIARKYPENNHIAPNLVLVLQDRLEVLVLRDRAEGTTHLAEREELVQRIEEIAARHPDDETIRNVHNLVRRLRPAQSSPAQSGCYVATAVYGSYDCPELWVLRRFRDRSLANSGLGRSAIRTYYAISPTLVHLLGRKRWFTASLRAPLNTLVVHLRRAGFESTPYSDPDSRVVG